jgi:hypothetical protein
MANTKLEIFNFDLFTISDFQNFILLFLQTVLSDFDLQN